MGEKRKKQIQWVVFFISIFVVMGILMWDSLARIKREGTYYYKENMITLAQDHAEKINIELQKLETSGKTAANILAATENPGEKEIERVMLSVLSSTDASRVIYHEGDGVGWEWDGNALKETDLTQYHYYGTLQNAVGVTYTYSANGSRDDAVIIVIPISGEVKRGLLVYYPMEKMHDFLRVSSEFDAKSFAILLDEYGTIITRSNYESSFLADSTLWNNVSREFQDEVTRAKIQMVNQTYGSFKAVSADNKETKTLVYVPIGEKGWFLVAGVNQNLVNRKEANYRKNSVAMAYRVFGVLAFFTVIFFVFNYLRRKKRDEADRMLREKADTDLLTGLNNKLATERKIKDYIEQYPDSMAMMFVLDIDNFKKINDTMGHAFGDEVLKTLGRTISPIFRVTDIIGRTGGDEFTIFLKFLKTDENTLKEAQKLVNFFNGFTAGEYVKYSATASIGAAVFPADGKDFETLYKAADKALYKAKQRGKNQLAFYDDRDRKKEDET